MKNGVCVGKAQGGALGKKSSYVKGEKGPMLSLSISEEYRLQLEKADELNIKAPYTKDTVKIAASKHGIKIPKYLIKKIDSLSHNNSFAFTLNDTIMEGGGIEYSIGIYCYD